MIIICEQCGDAIAKAIQAACTNAYAAGKTGRTIDPDVINTICGTLVNIALIAAATIIFWQLLKLIKGWDKSSFDREREKEDKKFKLRNDYQAKLLDHKKNELDNYEKLIKELTELIDKKSKEKQIDEQVLQSFEKGLETINNHNISAKAAYVDYLNKYIDELKK